ncbi:hypothetical protein [Haloferax sp. YSMS24]|uniref:hypothetical protein n=1 Tax=Haloferax sp. YSMS24 TaxID=3388425 RepID=UPI00398D192C
MTSKQDGGGRIDYKRRALLKALPIAGLAVVGSGSAAATPAYPAVIPLPTGFQPEGIVTGLGTEFFVGSLAGGAIYRGDLRTGEGDVFVSPSEGRVAVGLSHDARSNYLFVAGGPTGMAFVYDTNTGAMVADYDFQDTGTFVNDVVVTRTAAYFTDSFRPSLYRVPLGAGGQVPDQSAVEEIPLGGDFTFTPGAFNANGIDAPPNGEYLVVVNSTAGLLYNVDPATGDATEIDLGGASLTAGDGILLAGRTLYVVRNQLNLIAVVKLDPDALGGELVGEITNPQFDVPTTVAGFGNSLYAVNARFGIGDPANAEYDVVRVSK